jgi:hypothetical protein
MPLSVERLSGTNAALLALSRRFMNWPCLLALISGSTSELKHGKVEAAPAGKDGGAPGGITDEVRP